MLSEKEKINCNEIVIFIVCSLMGVDVLNLANYICSSAYQDAWMSIIIGSAYPFLMIFIVSKILPLCGHKTIVDLNKELLGNKIGIVLNLIFSSQFIFYTVQMTSTLVFINKVFVALFVSPIKICLVLCIIICFTASKGFKTIMRSCIVVFISMIILLLTSTLALRDGTLLNFQPVLSSGFKPIFNGALKTSYYYTTLEFLLMIHPYVKENKKKQLPKYAFIGISVSVLIYLWIIFVNIYKLGIGLIAKTTWPFIFTIQSINVPIFNNFRYIFLLLWNPSALMTIIIDLFIFVEIISKTFNIKSIKIYPLLFPLFFMLSYVFYLLPIASIVLEFITPAFVIFNFINFTLVLILLKRKNKNQKSLQNYN
ncbi:GerAB/ArcD/ProY family transporter [Clostridium frigidicarnis]|uniref:Spore germination protein (Amino acid permease) n=1 Tax=Clostridium frigidicarnis TaxID=84698 RepID=A0A1I1AXC4_9CLOT|nr:GerAB/ArcD/ProY family transporter [Clostridium frigidicarnis]SFB42739.1 spore germination protein (amino acid permease) [Clostridium frigidicarnis]